MRALRNRVFGICFLALLVGAVGLTYAFYTNQFADYVKVELVTSRIGLQLPDGADIKIRGLIVGSVLDKEVTDEGALLTLGIEPDEIEKIPADVTAAIVPKTLFGQKFVKLEIPQNEAEQHLTASDRITQTEVPTEIEKVLAGVYPLLNTVQPAQINATLNALATALRGRGEEIGQTIETLDAYLKRLNPQIPQLVEDLRLTAEVADIYTDVLPDITTILRNTLVTTGTLESQEEKLTALLTDITRFSRTARDFLATNEENLIRVAELAVPQLKLLARYAPEYPCLLKGLVGAAEAQAEAFRNFTLHIQLELIPNQPRGWTAADTPRFGADRGPYCGALPPPVPWSQQNPFTDIPNIDDGIDEPTGKGTIRPPVDYSSASYAGSEAERRVLDTLIGAAMGTRPEEVPDVAGLLVAPMARGGVVSLR